MKHKHGGDIYSMPGTIDFSANINPLGMPKSVLKAAKLGVEKSIFYPEVSSDKLREALAENYGISKDNIICGNGAAELIFSICNAKKPKKALLIAPSFAEYEIALHNVDCELIIYNLKEEENFKLLEDYISYLTPDIDIIFLCNPNNPTGQMIYKDFLIKVAMVCEENKICMVLDECFIEFSTTLKDQSMKDQVLNYNSLIVLNAFTKLYAMPGLRLGYVISKDAELLYRMEQNLQPWNVSLPAQFAGVAALKEKSFVFETQKMLEGEKEHILLELRKLEGIKLYGMEANYIFFHGNKTIKQGLLNQGIQIRDCSNYRGLKEGYYRIAIRSREENNRLLEALSEEVRKENLWQK